MRACGAAPRTPSLRAFTPSRALLLVDQHGLLPAARRLVGAVDATGPAARSLLPFQQLFAGSPDATVTCRLLFRVVDPADELVATKRRQTFPQGKDGRVRSHCRLKVFARLVDGALRKDVRHIPIPVVPAPAAVVVPPQPQRLLTRGWKAACRRVGARQPCARPPPSRGGRCSRPAWRHRRRSSRDASVRRGARGRC